MGADWARKHHFDTKGELPAHSSKKRGEMIRRFHRKHHGKARHR